MIRRLRFLARNFGRKFSLAMVFNRMSPRDSLWTSLPYLRGGAIVAGNAEQRLPRPVGREEPIPRQSADRMQSPASSRWPGTPTGNPACDDVQSDWRCRPRWSRSARFRWRMRRSPPARRSWQSAVLVHPMGRGTLDLAHGRGDRHRGRQREQQVRMVVHASNFEGLDFKSARDSSHVGPKPSLNIRRDDLAPFLGGEDAMIERGTIGVRHTPPSYSRFSPRSRRFLRSALTGRMGSCDIAPRVSPWAILLPPSGRRQPHTIEPIR